jgi:hypothetical protein
VGALQLRILQIRRNTCALLAGISRMTRNAQWTVHPHQPLEKLSENVWRLEGDVPRTPLRRVMTVVRRLDGSLVVHNGIAVDPPTLAEMEALGPIAAIVVPSGYHRMDAPAFAARYPDAKVFCPSGSMASVRKVVRVDGVYADFPNDARLRFEELDGAGGAEGVGIIGDSDGCTLVFNDAIFNMPHVSGVMGFVLKHLTRSSGGPRITALEVLLLLKDKRAFARHLERLASTENLRRIIVSHHETITEAPADVLRAVAATLA